ncbi:MAG: PAS domain S-box protein [Alphaproteobacteria bacterium]|nr:PAS domain S-box protein [Alphaproteobacteria bacterium]
MIWPQLRTLWRLHRRGLLWGALVSLVLSVLLTLVWLAGRFESEKLQMQTDREASDAISDLRVGLNQNIRLLESIIPAQVNGTAWTLQAEALLRERREWLRLEWRDMGLRVVAAVNSPSSQPLTGRWSVEHLAAETQLACRQARRWGYATYSPSTYVAGEEGGGVEVVQMCLPWAQDGQAAGYLVASYALPEVLSQLISPSLYRGQQLSFVEADGTRLAMVGQMRDGRRIFVSQQLLGLPGSSLVLRVDSRRTGPDLFPNLLTAVVAALSLALLTVLALLGRDTRRRQKAEHELAEALAFRKAMEDSLVTGLRARDLQGRITYVNPAFCEMVGLLPETLLGSSNPPPYWPPEMITEYGRRQALRLAGNAPPREGIESVFMRHNGERFPVLIFEAPLIDANGTQTGWMSAILDISEQRRIEELSRASQERLQATARLASMGEMASLLSHELNQPLAAISSYANGSRNLLQDGQESDSPSLRRHLSEAVLRIAQQAERAGQVIKSVHDFVRRRAPSREWVRPRDLLDSVTPLVRLQGRKLLIDLQFNVPDDLPAVWCDQAMVEQVILNLTRNGMQAMDGLEPNNTGGRRLTLTMRIADGHNSNPQLVVEVTDLGCGIDPNVELNLYTPFFTTKEEGMGLGLSLCRTVVEQHGGQLIHRPHHPRGTVFSFTLPCRHTTEPREA